MIRLGRATDPMPLSFKHKPSLVAYSTCGESDVARGRKIGIAASEIGDQGWLVFKRKWHGISGTARPDQSNFRLSRKIPISLSPRPEMFTITTSDFFILGARLIASATA